MDGSTAMSAPVLSAMLQNGATSSEVAAAIRLALQESRIADARIGVEAALERWPTEIGPRLLEGDVLVAEGNPAAAIAHYRQLQDRFPNNFWVPLRLARLLFQQNRLAEARAIFAEFVWHSSARDDDKSALVNALSHRHGDVDETARFLEGLLPGNEHHPVLLTRLASIRERQGRLDEALALFETAAKFAPLPDYAQTIFAELLIGSGREAEALPLAQALVVAHPDRLDHTQRLIMVLSSVGHNRDAALLLQQAVEKWVGDWRLLYRFNRMKPEPVVTEKTFAIVHARWPQTFKEDRVRFHYAVACLSRHLTAEALDVLRPIQSSGPVGHMARPLERALGKFSAADWCGRSRLIDDPAAQVQIVPVDGADTVIFVFTGIGGGLSYLPLSHADAVFADYRASIVYLRDYGGRAYLEGISDLASNREGTLHKLGEIATQLGARRIVMLGSSVGGFAAIRYAAELGAQAAVSFSGPTTLDVDFDVRAKPRAGDNTGLVKRGLSARVPEAKDLVRDITKAPKTRFYYYYAEQYEAETEHAKRFRKLRNVVLRPVADVGDHFVILHAIADRVFDRLLVDDLGIARR